MKKKRNLTQFGVFSAHGNNQYACNPLSWFGLQLHYEPHPSFPFQSSAKSLTHPSLATHVLSLWPRSFPFLHLALNHHLNPLSLWHGTSWKPPSTTCRSIQPFPPQPACINNLHKQIIIINKTSI